MARQRISRKDLKQPDQFITQTHVVFEWVQSHVREIVYGLVGLVVLVAIIVGWSSWQRSRSEQAAVMLHQALKLIETPAPQAGQTEPPPAPDSAKAIEQLQAITNDYGGTPAGAQAYWHLGHQYMAKGDAKAALSAYEEARDRFPKNQKLSYAMAILNVGHAQEATGACDQAITSYEAVQQLSIGWLQAETYLGMGRCHELNGDKDKAIAVYDRALADEKLSSDVQTTINERLARLQPPVTTPSVEPPKAEATSGQDTVESTEKAQPAASSTESAPATVSQDTSTTPAVPTDSSVKPETSSQSSAPASAPASPSTGAQTPAEPPAGKAGATTDDEKAPEPKPATSQ